MSLISTENFKKSLTQQNGERTKKAVFRWKKLLENSKDFGTIRTKAAKESTAMLLENQYRYLKEAATNTSIFGPQNGLTGGALKVGDNYAPGDNRLPRILIPMVRRIYPALMSNEVVGVQPMPGPVALGFALRYKYLKGALHHGDSDTKHIHRGDASKTIDHTIMSDDKHIFQSETEYPASGIKGIETKATLTVTLSTAGTKPAAEEELAATIVLIDGQGYPQVQTTSVKVTKDGKKFIEQGWGYTFDVPETVAEGATTVEVKSLVVGISSWGHTAKDGKGRELFETMESAEMGYQKVDTRFTGRADARLGEELAGGRWKFRPEDTGIATLMQQYEGTGAIAKTSFGFEKCSVEAGTRRLSTSWTLETEEDLKNTNGIDIEQEATQQMSYELQAEIDREMTVRMLYSCLSKGEWSLWDAQLADARWLAERQRAFYQHLIKMSIRMQTRNRRGPANFIVCTPDVAALLESLDEFTTMPAQANISTGNMATAKVGTLGGNRFSVYVDTRSAVYDNSDYGYGYEGMFEESDAKLPNYCMLGYKGAESYDAGIIYCPYIPIMVQQAVNPVDFTPQVGLMTRYGVLDNIFGAELYYHCIIIDSFAQPGAPAQLRGVYPTGYVTPKVAATLDADTTLGSTFQYPAGPITQ
ncbi:MAG: hypothetical protein IJD58_11890 [Lachnospiraceae bacterium]|nr:hypothetical protein [Lachnospiraceae bacterium]